MTPFSFGLGVVLFCLAFIAAGQAPPVLTFENGTVYLTGVGSASPVPDIPERRWKEILSVYTYEAFQKNIDQPIAGQYRWRGDSVVFKPSFPFASGGKYYAVFSRAAFLMNPEKNEFPGEDRLELAFEIPAEEHPTTLIESVYPQSINVPENLLRMYIYFSGAMMPGEAYDHIKLFNEKGERIQKAFLIIDQELWDPERKRLTILFDPGRIKRGLKSNVDLGAPLLAGQKYYLMIDSTWRDVNGNHLQSSFKKTLVVASAQRAKLEIKNVKVIAPQAYSKEAMIIVFDRSIDHGLVSKYISIHNGSSGLVEGRFQLMDDSMLKFMPELPWQAGTYTVTISPLLEDVAGNNFKNAFDLDLSSGSRVNSNQDLKLEVSIKPLAR